VAIRRVPFDASPKRRAVGSKVTVRVLVPPMGGKDREDVSRHVEQPGRRALEQVDAGLAVDWPALALLAARPKSGCRLAGLRPPNDLEALGKLLRGRVVHTCYLPRAVDKVA
jgi:hypothetical protein